MTRLWPERQSSRLEVVAAGPGALRPRGRAGPAAVLALGSGVAAACQEAAGAGAIASAERKPGHLGTGALRVCVWGVPGAARWRSDRAGGQMADAAPTALITGATSGLGRYLARQLASSGWQVLAHGRDPARMADL